MRKKLKTKGDHIVCIAKLTVKEKHLEDVKTVFADMMQKGPKEAGCLRYELHQDIENPLIFTFVDRFKDQAAFDFHCEQDYIKRYFDEILPVLTEEIEFSICRDLEA